MKTLSAVATAVAALAIAGSACAADFQAQVDRCLSAHANTHDAASVMLECDANGGKLANCKVLENSAPASKGFDKAALCVAEALPMPGKTGAVKIPLRFAGES